jgi:demethylmenaquinone methyltransferase/2-methoxy-6-polyprenyl-1,4-benzoquinol methylase
MKPAAQPAKAAPASGARPAGTENDAGAATAVRDIFDRIAPRYDLVNHVLSCNIDRWWWWRTARAFRPMLSHPEARILDICCGTGDLTRALLKLRPPGALPILAGDFSHPMLVRAAAKLGGQPVQFFEADALHLPLPDCSIDLLTCAFGFRNLVNYDQGLLEFHRVLQPGGALGILDFSQPPGLPGRLYGLYFHRVLPALGSLFSGSSAAYRYLPASVDRFPSPESMLQRMRAVGFAQTAWTPYSLGIAGLFRGVKQ